MCDRNLLTETKEELARHNKTWDDVIWVGNLDYKFSIDDFISMADFDYYAGFGSEKVKTDLMIVGEDWWLTRENYDGSEWWRYNAIPKMPTEDKLPKTLQVLNYNYRLYERERR